MPSGDPRLTPLPRRAGATIRISAKRGPANITDALPANAVDEARWLGDAIDRLVTAGASGSLFVFIDHPPDPRVVDVLTAVAIGRRLQPNLIAPPDALASRAQVELLERASVRAMYAVMKEAAATDDPSNEESGNWRRALVWLRNVRKFLFKTDVGVCFELTPQTARHLGGALRLVAKLERSKLLLWDGRVCDPDAPRLAAADALRVLDEAVTTARTLGVHLRPVGFERLRTAPTPTADSEPSVASPAMIELLREAVPLASASGGLLATHDGSIAIAGAVRTAPELLQISFELAGGGRPFVYLPPCLGGPPAGDAARPAGSCEKVEACRRCPIEDRCAGVPLPLLAMPGMRTTVAPPPHWMAIPARPRIALVCTVATNAVYGATFFSLARCLVELGARVDVVTPWEIHADISATFSEMQRLGVPAERSAVAAFMVDAPVEDYDVIITPDPKVTRPLVVSGRLRPHTRLAVTDFHMLGGIDEWVRDLCAPERRSEEGGWWPSDQVMLYSAFPGYGRLYTRYGVPMHQVAWQPYAVDPSRFEMKRRATEGTTIISAGNHRRDVDTFFGAVRRLVRNVHPIDLFGPPVVDVPPQVRFRGTVSPNLFCPEVEQSRFMVVPLVDDPDNAAGITAFVTAIVCGRPVIATATAAARDYVVDGVNGLLVPPEDPQAMAEAIDRLDRDPELLAALADGARAAAPLYTTEAWARALLHGSRTFDADHWGWRKWRNRRTRSAASSASPL